MGRAEVVLFDLDDTLFDHHGAMADAIRALSDRFPELGQSDERAWVTDYSQLVEELHPRVLAGSLSPFEARRLRWRRLLAARQLDPRPELVDGLAAEYGRAYERYRRPVPGAAALLATLRARGVRLGIVTNNLVREAADKLASIGLDEYAGALFCSESVGVEKPDPRIFAWAVRELGGSPSSSVMVGDRWETDVVGSRHAGLTPVWFNRFGARPPDPSVATIPSLEPAGTIASTVLAATDRESRR